MSALYVREQGAVLRRTGERLLVTKEKELLNDVPIIHIDQVVIVGNIQITTQAMTLLLQKEIDVVFLSRYGKYRGRLMTTGSKFAELRRRQLFLIGIDRAALDLARELVVAKLIGQSALLKRLTSNRSAIKGIEQAVSQARRAPALDSLRGYEGSGGAAYFGGLRTLIPVDWGFNKRVYHPPTDRVNAMLSLGYTLLLKDVTTKVQLVGLDPYIGVFHVLEQGRPSLCLDLMEPFRPIVDDLVLRLIAEGQVRRGEFEKRKKDGAMLLTETAWKQYLEAYEAQMARRVVYDGHQKTTVRRCLELQTRGWARVVLGKEKRFTAFVARG